MASNLDVLTKIKVAVSFDDNILTRAIDDVQKIQDKASTISFTEDAVEYLLDLTVFMLGTGFLTKAINKFMTRLLAKDSAGKPKLEKKIKDLLFKSLTKNVGKKPLPADFITTGYALPMSAVDLFDLFKIDPTTPEGTTFYGNHGFNRNFFDILQSSASSPLLMLREMPNVLFKYKLFLNTITLKGDPLLAGHTIEDFFTGIVYDDNFVLIDTARLIADMLNTLYNFLGSQKSTRALSNDEKLNQLIVNITQKTDVEKIFIFDKKQLSKIDEVVNKRKRGGYILDASCELQEVKLDIAALGNLTATGNYSEFLINTLDVNLSKNGVEKNDAIVDNYSKNLIKALIKVLIHHTILSPNIWMLFVLNEIFKTGYPKTKYPELILAGVTNVDILEILKGNKNVVTEITDAVYKTAVDFLTDIVIKEILKKISPFLIKIGKEKAENFLTIIESLI